ncbi:MAG: response regulator, partial [Elusimicrobiota bacterium]
SAALPAIARGFGKTILVVDDEKDIARMIVRLVNKIGHHGEAAYCAGEALRKIRRKDYDFILLDLEMPGTNGRDMYGYLSQAEPSMVSKLIFMTGDVLSPHALDFLAEHRKVYLAKPFNSGDLAKIIVEAGVADSERHA